MKTTLMLAMLLGTCAPLAMAQDATQATTSSVSGSLVSERTIGHAVSSTIGGSSFPTDPIRGATVRTIRTELPPNPVFPADEGPGPDAPFGG